MPGNILIIDDEEPLRKLLARIIALEGFRVEQASSLKEGDQVLAHKNIDVVICDVKLPDGNGVDFVKGAREKYFSKEFILLTAYGNIADGVQAIKNGAFDYITKGNDNDRIIPLLNQAMEKVTFRKKPAVTIREKIAGDFNSILGSSPLLKEALNLARKIAPTDTIVLLLGETGTGKEIFAKAIHANSRHAGKSFVALNCSAFTRELLEGELFGYKTGAFTGAVRDKKGLIEMADGGTLLLDEIGELHVDLQAKLLRVLENGEYFRLGDTKLMKVNIRIIAATNRDLSAEVKNGNFREDLFYRLNVFAIHLPALRERRSDIALLTDYFLRYFAEKENLSPVHCNKETLQLLQQFSWPGNIRELRNCIERAIILAENNELTPAQLPYELQQGTPGTLETAGTLSLARVEKVHIQKVLLHTKGNKTRTAELLGIGLTTLYRKIDEYGINALKSGSDPLHFPF